MNGWRKQGWRKLRFVIVKVEDESKWRHWVYWYLLKMANIILPFTQEKEYFFYLPMTFLNYLSLKIWSNLGQIYLIDRVQNVKMRLGLAHLYWIYPSDKCQARIKTPESHPRPTKPMWPDLRSVWVDTNRNLYANSQSPVPLGCGNVISPAFRRERDKALFIKNNNNNGTTCEREPASLILFFPLTVHGTHTRTGSSTRSSTIFCWALPYCH